MEGLSGNLCCVMAALVGLTLLTLALLMLERNVRLKRSEAARRPAATRESARRAAPAFAAFAVVATPFPVLLFVNGFHVAAVVALVGVGFLWWMYVGMRRRATAATETYVESPVERLASSRVIWVVLFVAPLLGVLIANLFR